ncbi:MAG: PD40 domain-containing protein [Bacteroidia bacterium]|nr:PD40 domain-containing protein [Bacteroidia bacterium]
MNRNTLLIFLICLSSVLFSQISFELASEFSNKWSEIDKRKLETADKYFSNQEFLYARPIYDSLLAKHPSNLYLAYLVGSCSIYDSQFQDKAEGFIKAADTLKSKLLDYDYYLGRAYLANDKFNEALTQFEKYKLNQKDKVAQEEIDRQIRICKSAINLDNKSAVAKITNIGKPINTSGSEYTPIFPSNESFMVYTYRGEKSMGGKQISPNKIDEKNGTYFEDIMISEKDESGIWQEPKPINSLNTNGHDAAVYLSHDGQTLFLYKNTGAGNGDIYESKLDGANWTTPTKIKGVNSAYWEGSICLSPDEKIIYFSSERPGGFGGRDIYYTQLQENGTWGKAINLGAEINTKDDEDSPFIHSDGKTLFFSSTGHNSMGGYDIFRSDLKQGRWTTPYNVGKPINTKQDDKFYVVSSDGNRGYYSSEKKEGFGQQDIYVVEPGLFGKPTALVMLTGKVTYDNAPVKAEIIVRSKINKKDFSGKFHSNGTNGKYLVNLPSGNDFEIQFKYLTSMVTKDFSTAKVDSFIKLELDAEIFSPEYLKLNAYKVDSSAIIGENFSNLTLTYPQILEKFGDKVIDSLNYTVQIGAYKMFENFDYSKLIGLPKSKRQTFSDNITRFTLGSFKTLNETNAVLEKAKKNGITDAFIIAIYKGERVHFTELLNQGVLK